MAPRLKMQEGLYWADQREKERPQDQNSLNEKQEHDYGENRERPLVKPQNALCRLSGVIKDGTLKKKTTVITRVWE